MTQKKTSPKSPSQVKKLSKKDFARLVGEGKTLGSIRGVSPQLREFLYHYGNACYQRGEDAAAERAFLFLALHFHKEADFWEALGEVSLVRHRHALAQSAWTMCFTLAPTVYHGCRLMRADGLAGQPARSVHLLPWLYEMARKQGKNSMSMLKEQCQKQQKWVDEYQQKQNISSSVAS